MICYKDRTYCNRSTCKDFNKCDLALTKEVIASAHSAGLLISVSDYNNCFEKVNETEDGD